VKRGAVGKLAQGKVAKVSNTKRPATRKTAKTSKRPLAGSAGPGTRKGATYA
jgi:hypothetical protein